MSKGLAFVGDLHMSRNTYRDLPNMKHDTAYALSQAVEFCTKEDYDLVLVGDIFDARHPEADVLQKFFQLTAGIGVAYIQGQHDLQKPASLPDVVNTLRHELTSLRGGRQGWYNLNRESVELAGIKLYGLDYTSRNALPDALKAVPKDCEVLCLHQMLRECMDIGNIDDEDKRSWDMEADSIPAHVKTTILGDYHSIPNEGVTNRKKWYYTGSATMRSINEPTAKSFITMTKGPRGGLSVNRVPLRTRSFSYSNFTTAEALDEFCKKAPSDMAELRTIAEKAGVPPEIVGPLVVIRYSADIDGAYKSIMTALCPMVERGEIYLRLLPARALGSADVPDYVADVDSISVQSAVDELVDKELMPEVHSLVSELADSATPRDVVTAYKHEHEVVDDPCAV